LIEIVKKDNEIAKKDHDLEIVKKDNELKQAHKDLLSVNGLLTSRGIIEFQLQTIKAEENLKGNFNAAHVIQHISQNQGYII
jgi:hypothetical protein